MEFARTSPKALKLILAARRVDSLREIAGKIKEEVGEGVKVLPVQVDVSKRDEVKGFVEGLPADFREIDVLVNNACVCIFWMLGGGISIDADPIYYYYNN